MGAIGLNPIRLDRIGLDPIRINAIKLGVPGAASGTDRPYIDPEVLASLKAVCICYGKSNDDPDRAVVKNLVDPDNPFVISNAAYDKMSSYGGYEFAKFDNTLDWYNTEGNDSVEVVSRNGHSITLKRLTGPNFWYFQNSTFRGLISNVIPFKVNSNKNIAVIWDVHGLSISEGKDKSVRVQELVLNPNEDNYTNLKTLNEEELAQIDISTNSLYYLLWFDLSTLAVDEEVTIEMLPQFEGAFVTDGIDDLITSTKTVQDMLGGSNECTVLSMMCQIGDTIDPLNRNNWLLTPTSYLESRVEKEKTGKTGIYGYTSTNISNGQISNINTILGDKNDYTVNSKIESTGLDYFSVEGFQNEGIWYTSSVAWYWTVIANKVLTTDQINQVIAYFNLDRTLNPDILCNITKQGITNDNHADFNDKLIDYSGNGRDIQMYNLAWKGGSGVAAKQYETFKDWTSESSSTSIIKQIDEFTRIVESTTNGYWVSRIKRDYDLDKVYDPINVYLYQDNNFLVHECKYEVDGVKYAIPINEPVGKGYHKLEMYTKDRYTELPENAENVVLSEWYFPKSTKGSIKYSIIPSCKGGLLLDGVNDFGQFVGDLGLKDYTLIMNRAYNNLINNQVPLISSNIVEDQTPFIVEHWNTGSNAISFSYGASRTTDIPLDINKKIVYQSTYSYMGYVIPKGNAISTGNGITLGKFGNGVQYSAICLWSLMLFPYSMSEFLIERQLKKHKLGSLYPNMMEFRPVIKSNVLLDAKPTFVIRGTSTHLNAGDYVPENSQIWVSIKMNNIADRITKFTVNGKTIDIPENAYSEVTLQYGFPFVIDKSPQKISITIEQDENYVKFEPVITSNVEYVRLDFYLNNYQKRINIGDYIPKDAYLRANLYLKNNVDELTVFTFNGVNIGYRRSSVDDTAFNINQIYNYDSPQEVNITIDEYIRYEDIVQPYPVLLRFNDENGNEVSWGDKIKVGSSITRIGSAADSNLLPSIYNIFGLLLNGNQVTSSKVIVEKTMVFKAKSAYIFDNNEPKCILSPRLLRIPNSSYKILGYIPDISGHGNHGVIHNSAYAEGSGVNEDGSYQFDGVDDFVTIPTTVGGKQVLMKVNWQSVAGMAILYDQRTNGGFAIFNRDFDTNENKVSAYRARNTGGSTYIDGILNKYIYASQLKDITHNIVELYDSKLNIGTLNPKIGSSFLNSSYAQMSLYDFMLFDEISTDDKIKQLNEYVGIEGDVWGILTQLSNSTLISNETLIKNE